MFDVAVPLVALEAAYARNDARKRANAPMQKIQEIELLMRLRVALSRDSQSAWSLTRRHCQRVVTLAQRHMADIFLYSGWK